MAQSCIWQVLNKQVFDERLDFLPKQLLKIWLEKKNWLEFEFHCKKGTLKPKWCSLLF